VGLGMRMRISGNTLLVASSGGHLVELDLVVNELEFENKILFTTNEMVVNKRKYNDFRIIVDANRNDIFKTVLSFFVLLFEVIKYRPKNVITSGASIGFLSVLISRVIFNSKCIWIESIANSNEYSLSCKFAKIFCDRVYVQSEKLVGEADNVIYKGKLL
jgi:hypothetical protein